MSVTSLHALLPEVDDAQRSVPWGLAPSSRRRCFAAGQPGVADGLMLVDSERGEEEKRKNPAPRRPRTFRPWQTLVCIAGREGSEFKLSVALGRN